MKAPKGILNALRSRFDTTPVTNTIEKAQEVLTTQMVETVAANEQLQTLLNQNLVPYRQLMAFYECAMMEVETKFRVLDTEFRLRHDRNPINSISYRLKSLESLSRKMVMRNVPFTIDAIENNIFDVAGVRVICTFPEDVFALEESLLSQDDVMLVERKDYITNPKPTGYRSLHLIIEVPIYLEHEKKSVKVEVQLRTISMNFWAALEHQLRYKKNLPEKEIDSISEELVQVAAEAADLDRRMQSIRDRIES